MLNLESISPVWELTQEFDALNRWDVARRFNIDRIHHMTRSRVVGQLERHGANHFRDAVDRLQDIGDREPVPSLLPVMNIEDFLQDGGDALSDAPNILAPFAHTRRWLSDVMSEACPFIRPSLDRHRIWMTAARGIESTGEGLYQYLNRARDTFIALGSPQEDPLNRFNALVCSFPSFPHHRWPVECIAGLSKESDFHYAKHVTGAPFFPSEQESKRPDPLRKTPPVFVFRNELLPVRKPA